MNLQEWINSAEVSIVDVRTPEEFAGGNVTGSVNIPLNEVEARTEELRSMQPLVFVLFVWGSFGSSYGLFAIQGFRKSA